MRFKIIKNVTFLKCRRKNIEYKITTKIPDVFSFRTNCIHNKNFLHYNRRRVKSFISICDVTTMLLNSSFSQLQIFLFFHILFIYLFIYFKSYDGEMQKKRENNKK